MHSHFHYFLKYSLTLSTSDLKRYLPLPGRGMRKQFKTHSCTFKRAELKGDPIFKHNAICVRRYIYGLLCTTNQTLIYLIYIEEKSLMESSLNKTDTWEIKILNLWTFLLSKIKIAIRRKTYLHLCLVLFPYRETPSKYKNILICLLSESSIGETRLGTQTGRGHCK